MGEHFRLILLEQNPEAGPSQHYIPNAGARTFFAFVLAQSNTLQPMETTDKQRKSIYIFKKRQTRPLLPSPQNKRMYSFQSE